MFKLQNGQSTKIYWTENMLWTRELFLFALLVFVIKADEDKDDGNDYCTTDKTNRAFNKVYFPHWNKFVNRYLFDWLIFENDNWLSFGVFRPKCDPLKDFSLTLERKSRNTDCIKIGRPWWAIQVIPLGFIPTFNSGMKNTILVC